MSLNNDAEFDLNANDLLVDPGQIAAYSQERAVNWTLHKACRGAAT